MPIETVSPAEQKKWETVTKPKLEAAAKKLSKKQLEKAAAAGGKVAAEELETRVDLTSEQAKQMTRLGKLLPVADIWAETHPEEVIRVGDKFYRAGIKAGESQAAKKKGLTKEQLRIEKLAGLTRVEPKKKPDYQVYDYDTGKFVPTTKEVYEEREAFYRAHPEVGPPGTPGKLKPLAAQKVAEREYKQQLKAQKAFEASHIKLKDSKGKDTWILLDDWNKWPEQYQTIALRENLDKALQTANTDIARIEELEKGGYIKGGTIDITAYLRDNPKDTKTLKDLGISDKSILQAQEPLAPPKVWLNVRTGKKITAEEYQALGSSIKVDEYVRDLSNPMVREALIEMIPVYGTIRYAQRVSKDGFTPGEIATLSLYSAIDIATFAFGVGAIAAGARAARGVGTMARLAGAARGAGQFVVAEIKAPYTMIRHPVATAKTIYRPFETLLHPKAVPLAAVETSFSTVRLPVKATGDDAIAARQLRDAITDAAIYGREAKATIKGTTVKLSPTTLNKVGSSVAVHTTPDVRPFMDGAVIRGGREGGLYIAPNVHTRFSYASAFGDLPEGGIKGALIIRDEKVLKALAPSGKLFRKTAEIEAMLPPGTRLPRPSQTIYTRDMSGDKVTLLVFGKPFTRAQVAKLKFFGTIDTLGQIFSPAIKVSRSERGAIKALDEMVDFTKQRTKLERQIATYRKAGDTRRLTQAEQSMARLTRRIDDLRPRIERGLSARATTRAGIAWAQYTDRGMLERWKDTMPRRPSVTRTDRIVSRRLPGIDTRRIGEPERRRPPVITREVIVPRIPPRVSIERLPVRSPGRPPVERPPERPPTRVPPERPPVRPPTRVPPERPPERPPVKPPPVSPPTRPPGKPPGVLAPPKLPTPEISQARRRKDYKGAVAWQQGALLRKGKLVPIWKVWKRPYEQKDLETFFEDELPVGVKTVKGIKSAYATVQQFRGKVAPRETQEADIGAFIATVHQPTGKPGGAGEIKFVKDPSSKVRGESQEGWKKLPLHTTIEQLIAIVFKKSETEVDKLSEGQLEALDMKEVVKEKPSAKVKFAKKALADKIEKITPAETARTITKANLTSAQKRELLRMMPDKERQQVELLLSNPEIYAPTRGIPKAKYQPKYLRRKKAKAKNVKPEPMLIGARL